MLTNGNNALLVFFSKPKNGRWNATRPTPGQSTLLRASLGGWNASDFACRTERAGLLFLPGGRVAAPSRRRSPRPSNSHQCNMVLLAELCAFAGYTRLPYLEYI